MTERLIHPGQDDEGLLRGLAVGVSSLSHCLQDGNLLRVYSTFLLRVVAPISTILYTGLAFTLLPVVLLLLIWAPGLLPTFLCLVPLWSLRLAQAVNPRFCARMFAEGVRLQDSELAEHIIRTVDRNTPPRGQNIFRASVAIVRHYWKFIIASIVLWHFSVVPVFGSFLTLAGQAYLVTRHLGRALMEPYLEHYSVMDEWEKNRFYKEFRWSLFGFSMPWLAILSIPFVGPMLTGLALAGGGDLYMRVIRQHTRDKRDQSEEIERHKMSSKSSVS